MPKSIYTDRHQRLMASLVAARKASGLTQAEVAAKLDRPQSFVAKYEGGERRLDVIEYLDVAGAVGFDPCDLLARSKLIGRVTRK